MATKTIHIKKPQLLNEELNLGGSNLLYRTEQFDNLTNLYLNDKTGTWDMELYISNANDLGEVGKLVHFSKDTLEGYYDRHIALKVRKTPGHKQEFIKWAHRMSLGSISFATSKMSTFITNRDNNHTTVIYTFDMDALRQFGIYAGFYWDNIVGGHYGDELELRLLPHRKFKGEKAIKLTRVEKYIKKIDIWMSAYPEEASKDMGSQQMQKLISLASSKNIPLFIYDFKWMCLKNFGQYIIKQKMPQDIIDKSNIFFVRRNGDVVAANNNKEYTFGVNNTSQNEQLIANNGIVHSITLILNELAKKTEEIDIDQLFNEDGTTKNPFHVSQTINLISSLMDPPFRSFMRLHRESIGLTTHDPFFIAVSSYSHLINFLVGAFKNFNDWHYHIYRDRSILRKNNQTILEAKNYFNKLQIEEQNIKNDCLDIIQNVIKINSVLSKLESLTISKNQTIGPLTERMENFIGSELLYPFGELFLNMIKEVKTGKENPLNVFVSFFKNNCVDFFSSTGVEFIKKTTGYIDKEFVYNIDGQTKESTFVLNESEGKQENAINVLRFMSQTRMWPHGRTDYVRIFDAIFDAIKQSDKNDHNIFSFFVYGNPLKRTVDLLSEYFQTETVDKFILNHLNIVMNDFFEKLTSELKNAIYSNNVTKEILTKQVSNIVYFLIDKNILNDVLADILSQQLNEMIFSMPPTRWTPDEYSSKSLGSLIYFFINIGSDLCNFYLLFKKIDSSYKYFTLFFHNIIYQANLYTLKNFIFKINKIFTETIEFVENKQMPDNKQDLLDYWSNISAKISKMFAVSTRRHYDKINVTMDTSLSFLKKVYSRECEPRGDRYLNIIHSLKKFIEQNPENVFKEYLFLYDKIMTIYEVLYAKLDAVRHQNY